MCSKVCSGVQSLAERCMQLKALNLSGCSKIKDVMIANLAEKCMHLESLTLNGCRMLSDEGVRAVVRYRGSTLKVFGLGWLTNISDEAVKPIFTFCSAIENLDLQSSNITDNCFMELTVLSSLKVLKLNNCNSITSLAIIKIAEGCPQLEKLDLSYCDRLTVDMVRDITLPEGCMLLI
jgi:F-box and leucine-rich repeat protein GRR1